MAGYSARQSSFTTGDTILAAHSNDEFNQLLAAFNATTGHTHDGTAGEGGPITSIRDADALNKVLVDSTNNHLEFYVEVSSSAVQQIRIQDGAIVPITDNDIDLGTSSLEFKDLFIDGTANIDTLSLDGTAITATGTEINLIDGGTSAGTTAVADADGIITNDGGTMRLTTAATFKTYFQEGISTAFDDLSAGDAAVNITTTAGDITIDAQGNDTDIIFKGTDGSADTTFLTIDGSAAGKATFNSDVVVGGDLTVTGDDIIMGTNTAGNLLIADGTNFNSVAVGSLSEISTVANDDVFLAVDTSGGGLKKIARSAIVSGLATSGAISNVVEDTTPQLGGNLDMNGQDIVTTSNADIELAPNGTGHVTIKGNDNQGTIQFNCESNSHGQQIKAAPHSESANNVLTLPSTGGDARLVSTSSTATLTNKTLTTPVITEIDSGSTITLDATTDIVLDADGGDVFFKDGGTTIGEFTNSSSDFVIKSAVNDKDMLFKGVDNSSAITALTLDMSAAGAASFNSTVTANAGVIVDNITIDGTEIDLSSGDLTIDVAGDIALDAGADVNLPANIGMTFGDDGEKIEGDGTDLTIASSAKINLTATSDVHIPNNVGIVFGGDSEKIEGDGTDLTISANNLTIDAAADINLDADGADVNIKDGGTTILSFTNSSSDAIITAGVQDKDIIFKGDDGGSAITSLTLDMSAGGIATFSAAANVAQQALTSSSNAVAWDASAKPNAFHVTTENTTFAAPTNNVEGAFIVLEINYNGSHTIAFNTIFEFAASTAPTFTSTDGKTDILVFRYNGSVWQEVGRTLNLSES